MTSRERTRRDHTWIHGRAVAIIANMRVTASPETQTKVTAFVNRCASANEAARQLEVNHLTIARVAAGLRVQRGTLTHIETKLAELDQR